MYLNWYDNLDLRCSWLVGGHTVTRERGKLDSDSFVDFGPVGMTLGGLYYTEMVNPVISNQVLFSGSAHSAGYDLASTADLDVSGTALVPTGVSLEFLDNRLYGSIRGRSGSTFMVGAGVVDPDYRGEIYVRVFGDGRIRSGERVAQILFERYYAPFPRGTRVRGSSGFGSSGKI